MDNEIKHYENKELWKSEKYINDEQEKERYISCIKIIPEDVHSLLDIGTGNGAFLYFLEASNKFSGLSVCGLERSGEAINNKLCESEILCGDIQDLKISDMQYDIVTAFEVIEHLPYNIYEKGLDELERIAKKYILISVPYKEKRRYIKCPYCGARYNQFYHMRSYDDEKMKELFHNSKLIKTQYIGESFESDVIIDLIKRLNDKLSSANGICPQCGYVIKENASDNKRSQCKIKKYVKEFILFCNNFAKKFHYKKKPRWIIGLYKKEL